MLRISFATRYRTTKIMAFSLSPHVFACITGGRFVFLDLRRDQYFCLDRTYTDILACVLDGQMHLPRDRAARAELQDAKHGRLLSGLVERGILTTAAQANRGGYLASVSTPMTVLMDNDIEPSQLRAIDVLKFALATIRATAALRWGTIEKVVRVVRKRKALRHTAAAHLGIKRVRERVGVFNSLRPIFPRNYLCLFDSLALLDFLSYDDIFPTWVFGVRTDPFHAHCWVQQGDVVYNDEVEHVRSYTAILVV